VTSGGALVSLCSLIRSLYDRLGTPWGHRPVPVAPIPLGA
jgi:hypothetical protein